MRIRVITVAFNPGAELEAFLASLPAALHEAYECVIVDNGSEHAEVDRVARAHGARVVRTGENIGYGRAANRGAQGFTGEWLAVANPDVVFTPGSLDALVRGAESFPRAGALGPLIRTPEGEIYPSARQFPRIVSGVGHALLGNMWPNNPFSRSYRSNADVTRAHPVDWLSGACLLLRREAFEAVGGFDDSYFMFFEDVALGEALARASWQSIFLPEAEVIHSQGASWKDQPAAMLREHHRSAAHYIDSVYARPWQAPLRWAIRGGLALRAQLHVRAARAARRRSR
ncbi:glycosyltransferase family 2 protein [Actinotignum sp. GS-2025c]|uniref:glycosyltransferase family 2 protein n=1 Tax=Actinotignum sp. GS-2025c TaxID=3427276 RepID=UPI003F46B355